MRRKSSFDKRNKGIIFYPYIGYEKENIGLKL
jgi:hypothetical protein